MTERRARPGRDRPPAARVHANEMEAERLGWYAVVEQVRRLSPTECLVPGYYRGPDWTVRDLVAHLGTWLAEAEVQFERMTAGTYGGHDVDVEALNAALLEAMAGQPWEVAWVQANAARTQMLQAWSELPESLPEPTGRPEPSGEVGWWIAKSGAGHYAEHLPRLRDWVEELAGRRGRSG